MINDQFARDISLKALLYISDLPEERSKFMIDTGFDGTNMAENINNDGFLAAVIRYLREDESLLVAFCTHYQFEPKDMILAQHLLEGQKTEDYL